MTQPDLFSSSVRGADGAATGPFLALLNALPVLRTWRRRRPGSVWQGTSDGGALLRDHTSETQVRT